MDGIFICMISAGGCTLEIPLDGLEFQTNAKGFVANGPIAFQDSKRQLTC